MMKLEKEVVVNILDWMLKNGWIIQALTPSSIQGSDGNIEFLVHLKPTTDTGRQVSLSAEEWYFTAVPNDIS